MTAAVSPPIPTSDMRGFGDYIGTRTIAIKPDWGLVELDLAPWHLNGLKTSHGGVILTLLDHACGAALTFRSDKGLGKAGVTLSLNASFIRGVQSGKLFAEGRCIRRGRSIAFCEAHVENEAGEMIARGSGSFKLIG